MASYNTSGITSYTDTSSIAGISAASGQNYGSSSSGLMSSSSSKGRNLDADMYAGSKYAPTSNAGTAQANQSFTAFATSSDDDNDYTPAALALQFEAAGATLPAAINPMDRFRDTMASSLYDSDIFKPYVPDPTEEIESYLANTAVEDAIKEALGIDDTERQIYQGIPTQEEPEPNIDMSVLQEAMMPEPITVEKLEVKAGDTLSSIAAENNLPVQDVIDANPQIKNPNMIRPGEMVSMPEAWQIASDGRAELIMKGVEKLFGLFPPKSAAEKKAKSELQYFLDAGQKLADSSDGYPSWFKYIPDKIQLADYIVDKMNRNLESTIRESAEIDAAKRDAAGITSSLTPEEVAERNKTIGAMNFSDRSALTSMDNFQFVDIEDETAFNEEVKSFVELNEGRENTPYKDTKGLWTVGVGHLIGKTLPKEFTNSDGTPKKLSDTEVDRLFEMDYEKHKQDATQLPMYNELDSKGKQALIDLSFNMGSSKFNEKKWPKFFAALKAKDLDKAALELKDSNWFTDVKRRAPRVIKLIKQAKFN